MHDYDVVLRTLLQRAFHSVTGKDIVRWLPTELPWVQNLRIDLLGETAEGELLHIEVQSTNQAYMPFRMLEYLVLVTRVHRRVPKQILLYVGRDPMRMRNQFEWADGVARFTLIDIREVDGEPLLASPELSDNVVGILARLRDRRAAVRSILKKLSGLSREQAEFYHRSLLVLAGLRGLEKMVEEEAEQMLSSEIGLILSENSILGPAYRQGREEGRQEGRQEGQVELLRRLIVKRFGSVPAALDVRLHDLSPSEVENVSLRIFDANRLEDLFPEQ